MIKRAKIGDGLAFETFGLCFAAPEYLCQRRDRKRRGKQYTKAKFVCLCHDWSFLAGKRKANSKASASVMFAGLTQCSCIMERVTFSFPHFVHCPTNGVPFGLVRSSACDIIAPSPLSQSQARPVRRGSRLPYPWCLYAQALCGRIRQPSGQAWAQG